MTSTFFSVQGLANPSGEVKLGISACLLGDEVRFDGGHKHERFLTGTVAQFVTFVPVCPEVDIGLGVPRESLRLVQVGDGVRLVAPRSGSDHTEAMRRYAHEKVEELKRQDLCGYILKRASPSCGMERVRLYNEKGMPEKKGVGLFAEVLLAEWPHLPVEEEGRLHDPVLRENFFERVFAYARIRGLFSGPWRLGDLVAFHSREKMLLLAHHRASYEQLGRLVATARGRPALEVEAEYTGFFMEALAHKASRGEHFNVLQHMLGHFKDRLEGPVRARVLEVLERYREGLVPLVVPVTLLHHYVDVLGVEYLAGQTYLCPHPRELMLRNHC